MSEMRRQSSTLGSHQIDPIRPMSAILIFKTLCVSNSMRQQNGPSRISRQANSRSIMSAGGESSGSKNITFPTADSPKRGILRQYFAKPKDSQHRDRNEPSRTSLNWANLAPGRVPAGALEAMITMLKEQLPDRMSCRGGEGVGKRREDQENDSGRGGRGRSQEDE